MLSFREVGLGDELVGVGLLWEVNGVVGLVIDAAHLVFHLVVVDYAETANDAGEVVSTLGLDLAS